jgi:amino acid transporter
VITAMAIGALIYILLEIAFIGSLDPANLIHGWANPIAKGDFGPYATLAVAAGAGWLAYVLYADAFVSPAGTGLVYVATSARLTYALGRENLLPGALGKLTVRGVPLWSIMLAFVIGEISFLPFPSWQSLVGVVTSATAIMYGFAPIAMAALRKRDPERARPYKLPFPAVLAPVGFVSANLIIYWGGFDVVWKILVAIVIGLGVFAVTYATTPAAKRSKLDVGAARWLAPWLLGQAVIGYFGRYGDGARNIIPEWLDLLIVVAFSLVIFYWAVSCSVAAEQVKAAVDREELELAVAPEVNLA